MNIVDSSGWLEYFIGGSNADFFAPIIENTGEVLKTGTVHLFNRFQKGNTARYIGFGPCHQPKNM